MSRWIDAFNSSNLELNISKVQKHLKSAIFKKIALPYLSEVKRVRLFIEVADTICKKVDPDIMPTAQVTQLAGVINTINTNFVNYISAENPDYLKAAADNVDSGIVYLQSLSLMLPETPVVSNAVLRGLLKKTSDYIVQLTKKKVEFTTTVNGLKRQVATQEKKVNSVDRVAQRKIKVLEKQIADFDKKFETQQASSKKEFHADQGKRKVTFDTQLNTFKRTLKKEQDQSFIRLNKDIEKQKTKTLTELVKIKEAATVKHEELISIVGIASGDAMRAQHQIAAKDEEGLVTMWRSISFGSFIVAVLYVLLMTLVKGMSVDTSIMMAPLMILLLSASAYAARIAAGHRREAIRIRQFSLEMEAVLPYLDALERSPDDSKVLRNKLAEKFFGNLPSVEVGQQKNESHLVDTSLQKIVEMLKDVLKR